VLSRKKVLGGQEIFLQPPPGKRYIRSFLFTRKIDAPFARIHLIPRTLLVFCRSSLALRAIDATQPDLVEAICLWGVCFLIFLSSGIPPRVARVYLLLSVPTLFSLLCTWLLFDPLPGNVTLLKTQVYGGILVFSLAIWQVVWVAIVAIYFWITRKLLAGILLATVVSILFVHFVPLPTWVFARMNFLHPLTILISDRNLLVAVTKVIGYAGMIFVTVSLIVSSRDIELIGTMRQLHLPQPIIFFLSTVFRALDLSLVDYGTIHQAQIARAINARPRNIIKRLRDLGSIAIPMVAVMIRRSSEIGDALISRGYQLRGSQTDFYEIAPWRFTDSLTIIVCCGLAFLAFGPHSNLTLLWQRWF